MNAMKLRASLLPVLAAIQRLGNVDVDADYYASADPSIGKLLDARTDLLKVTADWLARDMARNRKEDAK